MDPLDAAILTYQRGAGKLQHVAVLLECPSQTDGKSRGFGRGTPPASFGLRKQDAPPVGALETHRTVALPGGIRNANRFDAVAAAEPGHL